MHSCECQLCLTMWTKRTDQEIASVRAKARRNRIFIAAGFTIFCFILSVLGHGRYRRYRNHSADEAFDNSPVNLLFVIPSMVFFGWCSYRFLLFGKRKVVLCPKCEPTKYEDVQPDCPCGGHIEDMETMKWIEP